MANAKRKTTMQRFWTWFADPTAGRLGRWLSIPSITAAALLITAAGHTYQLIDKHRPARNDQQQFDQPVLAGKPSDEPAAHTELDMLEWQRQAIERQLAFIEPAAGGESSLIEPSQNTGSELTPPPPVIIEGTMEGLEEAAKEVSERYQRLRDLERQLELREVAFGVVDQRLQENIVRLEGLRDEIKLLLAELSAEDARKITRLVKTYETMKAKKAALIFNRLELEVLIPVVERMREAKVAAILAAMDPDRAKIVTSKLAEKTEIPAIAAD